jgi:NDP-sugar pyrophosphorylase family protein
MIDAVILCGGLGTRLREEFPGRPKALVDLGGVPFLDFLVGQIAGQGVTRVILCAGHLAGEIEHHFKSEPHSVEIVFSKEDRPLGTGGALRLARQYIQTEPFFVFNGDSFCRVDLARLMHRHHSDRALATMVLSRVPDADGFGRVLTGPDRQISQFLEKDGERSSGWINGGIYCFSQSVFEFFPENSPLSLEYDCFPLLVGQGFYGFSAEDVFFDIGTPERLRQARQIIKSDFQTSLEDPDGSGRQ